MLANILFCGSAAFFYSPLGKNCRKTLIYIVFFTFILDVVAMFGRKKS